MNVLFLGSETNFEGKIQHALGFIVCRGSRGGVSFDGIPSSVSGVLMAMPASL
jgi:hypothetical protein